MKFIVELDMDNDAFRRPRGELVRILRKLTDEIEKGQLKVTKANVVKLLDINGNTVGFAGVLARS